MSKRKHLRHRKRLEAVFTSAGTTYRGITSDISDGGVFIRTANAFAAGVRIDITLHLPDGKVSKISGVVRQALRTQIAALKNGMGIEITSKDSNYINLVNSIHAEKGFEGERYKSAEQDFSIISCPGCSAKNKVRAGAATLIPKCGKCGNPLIQQKEAPKQTQQSNEQPGHLILACSNCKAKNKVSRERLSQNPRCGKCGTTLKPEDIV